jgi:hypothetical protein
MKTGKQKLLKLGSVTRKTRSIRHSGQPEFGNPLLNFAA